MNEDIRLSNRFGFGRIFEVESSEDFSPVEIIEQLPETKTAENGLKSGFKSTRLKDRANETDDVSEYLEAFSERFLSCRYWFETREKRAVLSKGAQSVEEKTIESVNTVDIFFDEDQYIFVMGRLEACENSESVIREITNGVKIREVLFDSDFLTWMFYKSREKTSLRREFSLQRIVDMEFVLHDRPRQMRGSHKNRGMENSIPALENILQGADITRLYGEFEVAGYSVNGNIWRGEQVRIPTGGSLAESTDLRRLVISLRFIHELTDLYSEWRFWPDDRKYPPTDFYYDIYKEIEDRAANLDFSFEEAPIRQSSAIKDPETIASESEAEIIDAEIEEILETGETETIEFKEDLPGHREKIAKEVVALANRKGGVLVLGIEDEEHDVVGVPNYREKEEAISNILAESVEPPLNINIEFEKYNGKSLIVLRVGQYRTLPHAVDYTFYTRLGTTKRKLAPYELSYLMPDRED